MDIFSILQMGLQEEMADTLSKFHAPLDLFEMEKFELVDDTMTWKTKHPEEWTNDDVIEWIYSVAALLDMKMNTVHGENFQNLNGPQLCLLSIDEFLERDKANGAHLYHCLQDLLQQSNFFPPSDFIDLDGGWEDIERLYLGDTLHRSDLDSRFDPAGSVQQIPSFSVFLDPPHELPFDDLSSSPFEDGYSSPPIPAFISSYTVDSDVRSTAMQDSGYESAESGTDSSTCTSPKHGGISPPSKCALFPHSQDPFGPRSGGQRVSDVPRSIQVKHEILTCHSTGTEAHPPKRKPGRPPKRNISLSSSLSSSSSSSSSSDGSCLPSAPKKSKKKNTHLWKFMRALLEDPVFNPVSIKWENKQDGVFRIVPGQSKFIAKLWGQRKNNPSMTFDKMSRSLRWCRTYGFLSEVPKDGNYPKKLCFRFGDRAANWQQ